MKRLLTTVAILSTLASPMAALAQDHHDDHEGHPSGQPHSAPAPAPHQPQAAAPASVRPQGAAPFQRPQFPGGQGGYRPQPGQPNYRQPIAPQAAAPAQGRSNFQGQGQGQGGYRPQGEYQPQGGYRAQGGVQAQGGFRQQGGPGGQNYRPGGRPGGWDHHYWRRGEFLPSVFFLSDYYINDWYDFGLWEPDYGYQWIRVGYDALLINLATGQVVDSVPGVYYY
jgi:Ni/Co efflux regulator RcnB